MATYAALTPQTLAAGDAIVWQTTIAHGCCDIQHRNGTSVIALRGSGCCCKPKNYRVCAHVVITATTADNVQLQLEENGVPIPGTVIGFAPVAVGTVLSGDVCITVPVDCGCTRLSLVAITAAPITTAVISIDKEA